MFDSGPETTAFVLSDEAVLTFRPRGAAPANGKVVCVITTPAGTEVRSVRGGVANNTVAVRFPADFSPEVAVENGAYTAAWFDVPSEADAEPSLLASDAFEVLSA